MHICYWCGGDLEYDTEINDYYCPKCRLSEEGY